MGLVSTYMKTTKLQLETDKRRFRPDKPLIKLFNLAESEVKDMTFVEINKYISKHITKVVEPPKVVEPTEF